MLKLIILYLNYILLCKIVSLTYITLLLLKISFWYNHTGPHYLISMLYLIYDTTYVSIIIVYESHIFSGRHWGVAPFEN